MATEKLHDPLDDLKQEIRDEEAVAAVAAGKEAPGSDEPDEADDQEEPETDPEGDEEAQQAVEGKKPAAKAKDDKADREKLIPISRLNEVEAKRRKAEREAAATRAELEALRNPKKPGETKQPTVDEIRAAARAEVRLEMQLEEFVTYGNKEYTKEVFDEACNMLVEVGAPGDLIQIAMEATGSPAGAAKALYLLAQEDVTEIESFVKASPLRQAAQLARLATSRTRRAAEDDDPKPRKKAARSEVDEPPTPISPVRGNGRAPDGLGDDVPDELFTERFDKLMDAKHARRH